MKMRKNIAVSIFILLLAVLTLSFAGCSASQNAYADNQNPVTRGDLTVKVNGNGKLSYATDARLAFGTTGKIAAVTVKKGDQASKGAVLAQLDAAGLELALSQSVVAEAAAKASLVQAKLAVAQAESDVDQAGVAVAQTEIAITQAESDTTRAVSAVSQAEVSLTAARINLEKIQAVKEIKDDINNAEWQIAIAKAQITGSFQPGAGGSQYWSSYLAQYQGDLAKYQDELAKLLAKDAYAGIATYEIAGLKYDRTIVEDSRLKEQQVQLAQQEVTLAQQNVDKAQQNISLTRQNAQVARQNASVSQQKAALSQLNIDQANLALAQATKGVAVAQKQLEYATITAPFDGFVAELNLKTGDFVNNQSVTGGATIYFVDPATLEIDTSVDEIDVADLQVGHKAVIGLDAVHGNQYDGEVRSISLTPATNPLNPGVVVYSVKVGFAGNPPVAARSGMSASVDIVTCEKKGVVLVPNKSVKRNSQGKAVISVVSGQKLEERQVVLGQSDGANTEVISGLQEGERIIKVATGNSRSS